MRFTTVGKGLIAAFSLAIVAMGIAGSMTAQLLGGRVGGYVSVCRFIEPRAHFNLHEYDPENSA